MIKIKVFFKQIPLPIEIIADTNQDLLKTLISNGVNIYASCGGKGSCGKCKIKVLSGEYKTENSRYILDEKENIILACKSFPVSDISVEILEESQINYIKTIELTAGKYDKNIYENFQRAFIERKVNFDCVIKKLELNLKRPTIEDFTADIDRIVGTVEDKLNSKVLFENIKIFPKVAELLRENNWNVDSIISEKICGEQTIYEICDIVPHKKDRKIYSAVVDVGTTTVVVCLIDLINLEVVDIVSAFNQQVVYGQDVITRIVYSEEKNGLSELNQKIVFTINDLLNLISNKNKISFSDIYALVASGNTTMIHFLLNLPAKYIRREPYIPLINNIPAISTCEIGLMINPNGKVYSLPLVASYVGGDIVSGVVACDIDVSDEICVLLDLGTNGEIFVGNREFSVAAACSCGPAFEGSGITSGMMATKGAIEDIKISNGEISYKVIGNVKPIGICGSGLIAIPAELLKSGIIDRAGKFIKDVKTEFLKHKIRQNEYGEYEFVIVEKEFSGNNKDIVITESDIQNILRSKGAIFHGLYTLLKYLNLNFSDIKKIYISGGFGNFLDIKKAKILGLLPDIEDEKFIVAGNTSLTGAILFLVSKDIRNRVNKIAEKMTYVDLSNLPMYMNEYTSSLFIPHTELSLFPNVDKFLKNL